MIGEQEVLLTAAEVAKLLELVQRPLTVGLPKVGSQSLKLLVGITGIKNQK